MAKFKEGDVVIVPMLENPYADPEALVVWPCAALVTKEGDERHDYCCRPLICGGGHPRYVSDSWSEDQIATLNDEEQINRVVMKYWEDHQR